MASPPPLSDPGAAHEQRLAATGQRKVRGAFYTPPALVEGVLDLAVAPVVSEAAERGPDAVAALRIIDPACGSGRFLVAVGERLVAALVALGVAPAEARALVVTRCLHGVDSDPEAVRLARQAVRDLGGPGGDARAIARRLVVGDGLVDGGRASAGSFDVVVGNPPFLNQLDASTARSPAASAALRDRFGAAIGAYTDPAAAFLLAGLELVRPDGGVVALVEPVSLVSSRDAGGVRQAATAGAALTDLWLVGDGGFDAAVEVCVPVLVRGGRPSGDGALAVPSRPEGERTRVHRGPERLGVGAAPMPVGRGSWSGLLAVADGLPERTLAVSGVVGDLARATADFRDQYYGLAPHVVDRAEADDTAFAPLVTVGLVDPGRSWWGERPTRFNKVTYRHPRVEVAALAPGLQAWARSRLVPKVLVATQTRVLEAVADPGGMLLPSVPVISVVPDDPERVWHLAAVLTCPAVALVAARRHGGSGRSARALRLRAAEVAELPLPADRAAWDAAADRLRSGASVAEVGAAMDRAYGLVDDRDLLAWWLDRFPTAAR